MKKLFTLILAIILIIYPLGVYLGLRSEWLSVKAIGAILCALFLLRLLMMKNAGIHILRQLLPICVMVVITSILLFIFNDPIYLFLNPALINFILFCCFSYSVLRPPTVIQNLASIKFPDLPVKGIAYCRKVTIVWCVFFVINGSISLATAIHGDKEIWALYNGLISYVLMGLVFAVEFYFRRKNIKIFDAQMALEKEEKEKLDE